MNYLVKLTVLGFFFFYIYIYITHLSHCMMIKTRMKFYKKKKFLSFYNFCTKYLTIKPKLFLQKHGIEKISSGRNLDAAGEAGTSDAVIYIIG